MKKAPEPLLSVQDLVALMGYRKNTITDMMKKEWAVPGGAKMIRGEYRLPVGFYNRWVETRDVALAG